MPSQDSRLVALVIAKADPPATGGPIQAFACQNCGDSLALHQLDVDRPSELIGFCGGCRELHMMRWQEGFTSLLVAHAALDRIFCTLFPQ